MSRTKKLEKLCEDYREERDALQSNQDLKPEVVQRRLGKMRMEHAVSVRREREARLCP